MSSVRIRLLLDAVAAAGTLSVRAGSGSESMVRLEMAE
jgi:hypothetical protein